MNRSQKEQLRKRRKEASRENYQRNKRDWLYRYGPRVVMEQPTDEHIKALLMQWVSVNNIVKDAKIELDRRKRPHTMAQLFRVLDSISSLASADDLRQPMIREAWMRLMALQL